MIAVEWFLWIVLGVFLVFGMLAAFYVILSCEFWDGVGRHIGSSDVDTLGPNSAKKETHGESTEGVS